MPSRIEFPELPDWHFTVDERSAGVFEAVAIHSSGRSIAKVGFDPDVLLEKLRSEASTTSPAVENDTSEDCE